MTTEHPGDDREHTQDPGQDGEHMAEVVPLRAADAGTETAFGQSAGPAYLDTSSTGEARRLPIIPEHLSRARIRQTIGEVAGLHWYKARYHGFRSPAYAAKTLWYAARGVFRLARALLAWANWADGWVLESLAVAAGRSGHHDAMNAHMQGRKTRAVRWQITGVCFVAAVAALLAMIRWLPLWGWALAAGTVVAVLSRHGAPEGQRIVRAAVVPTAYQPPTPEVITRALGRSASLRSTR
jgi:DNA segregation ATPase FtsK/SpoIIIE, S-DNA-T family